MRDDEQYFGTSYFEETYWPPGFWGGVAAPPPPTIRRTRCPHTPKYNKYHTEPGKLECIDKNYWVEGKKLHWRIRRYK